MDLKNLLVNEKVVDMEYPGNPGLIFKVAHLSRDELVKLRKRCVHTKFDRKTRQPVEELDEDLFAKEFTKAVVRGWDGFKYSYLENFILVDLTNVKDEEAELEYSQDNALILMQNSTEFDTWINEVVFDLAEFRSRASSGT